MKIIYFTTACEKNDYITFSKYWNTTLNTSIQNLHNRLIRSLALTNEVEVISIRPFSKKYCRLKSLPSAFNKSENINWHYLNIKRNKMARFHSAKRQAMKLISKMDLKNCVVITDTLNPYILNSSVSIAKKFHLPIIGVCNNTPSGIHNTGRSYTQFLLSMANNLSGYVALTTGLDELYNEQKRASIIIEGILDNDYQELEINDYQNYIFYNGSLEEKYGVFDLINAYKELNDSSIKLLISGYHLFDDNKFNKAINGNPNIIYLGMLNNDAILSYMNKALVNVNPRPYSEDFDRYLIPVNMIDYLSSSAITVSIRNNRLLKCFKDDCIWIDSTDKLLDGLKFALKEKNNNKLMIKKANEDVNRLYAMNQINKKLILFLKQFVKEEE